MRRLESFLSEEEWIIGSEIIVFSGGSTDGTNEILRSYKDNPQITVVIEEERLSKIRSVNRAVEMAVNDILVFSDCRQAIRKGSVKNLVANFSDSDVGTVTSRLVSNITPEKPSIRTLLNQISICESKSGSCLNVFGALYAQRKSVFRKIPENLLFDDLFVVVSTLTQKKRLVMEPEAVLFDVPFEIYYKADRIKRLTRGLLIFLTYHFSLIWTLRFWTFLRFMIFKYVKLALPLSILFSLVCLGILAFSTTWNYIEFISVIAILLSLLVLAKYVIHFLAINFYMLIATIGFYFLNEKSNSWNKLKVK